MFLETVNTLAPNAPTLPTSVGVAIAFGYALDLLKRLKSVPSVNFYTTKLNTWLRVILSGVGTLGITWTWSAAGAGHQLLLTIPAWSAVASGAFHWFVQYGMQHGFEGILQVQRQLLVAAQRAGELDKP